MSTPQEAAPAPDELAHLSLGEIQARQAELLALITQTTSAIARVQNHRAGLLARAEQAELPALTMKVYRRLALQHPKFPTAARTALAMKHAKLWGIFNRAGTLAALAILRKEYRGYMESVGFVETEDRELLQLQDQLARLREELFKFEQLELLHPQRGQATPLEELAPLAA
ncbi:hypothetical protein AB4Y45_32155 [Paraburkholderia sp. EG287A]|uniref:hypothetical protein n=1 Tax=Paraburkholderia sp. EG287A TaxID=3237012 RepID=UPI0034D37B05